MSARPSIHRAAPRSGALTRTSRRTASTRLRGWLAAACTVAFAACQPADQAPVPAPDSTAGVASTATYVIPPNVAATPAPVQPVPFSHATHAGTLGLPCALCHVGADPSGSADPRTADGAHMTLPEPATCMNCHAGVAADSEPIRRLAALQAAGEGVAWERVYRVLPGVNWTHRKHIEGGLACQTCHGDVATLTEMSMQTAVTAMASCLGCHRSGQASADCITCHSWPLTAGVDTRRYQGD